MHCPAFGGMCEPVTIEQFACEASALDLAVAEASGWDGVPAHAAMHAAAAMIDKVRQKLVLGIAVFLAGTLMVHLGRDDTPDGRGLNLWPDRFTG